ncbi:hypothetical protein C8F01DRAFT_1271307 [Mycena amicta]|nr:hypothetical protein C8F01DRAFT_1271307 [Mycena amicta]
MPLPYSPGWGQAYTYASRDSLLCLSTPLVENLTRRTSQPVRFLGFIRGTMDDALTIRYKGNLCSVSLFFCVLRFEHIVTTTTLAFNCLNMSEKQQEERKIAPTRTQQGISSALPPTSRPFDGNSIIVVSLFDRSSPQGFAVAIIGFAIGAVDGLAVVRHLPRLPPTVSVSQAGNQPIYPDDRGFAISQLNCEHRLVSHPRTSRREEASGLDDNSPYSDSRWHSKTSEVIVNAMDGPNPELSNSRWR